MADVGYVAYVHNLGYEVWPLVSDFGMKEEIDEGSILSSYESRRALITNIMNEIKLYGYDGINIDLKDKSRLQRGLYPVHKRTVR